LGWQDQGGYVFTLDEPSGADTWFPSNDHPSDKATYEFRITVPKPEVAAANGVLVATEDQGADQTFVWEMRQPLATYLAQVTVGDYVVQTSTSPQGVALRNYFSPALADKAEAAFARTGEILDYFVDLFGPYPFDAYGVVVPPARTGAAMENQTLSLFGEDMLEKRMFDPTVGVVYLAHELAHQWYGDSVTVSRWQDIWLNEGFAEYASWLWLEHDQGPGALKTMVDESVAALTGERFPPLGDPGVDGMFSDNVYRRGALTLHALRLTVGDQVFFGILKDWAAKYRYANATTADFIALVRADAGGVPPDRLTALFDSWLFGGKLPALPGSTP
jgi:aminopeptidase N